MKYYGKQYLYHFLQEHGYDVSEILKEYGKVIKMKDFNYYKFRGSEWLKSFFSEIEVYSPCRRVVYVMITKIDDETGEKTRTEYSKYIDGVLNYQEKNGKLTIIRGEPYIK